MAGDAQAGQLVAHAQVLRVCRIRSQGSIAVELRNQDHIASLTLPAETLANFDMRHSRNQAVQAFKRGFDPQAGKMTLVCGVAPEPPHHHVPYHWTPVSGASTKSYSSA